MRLADRCQRGKTWPELAQMPQEETFGKPGGRRHPGVGKQTVKLEPDGVPVRKVSPVT